MTGIWYIGQKGKLSVLSYRLRLIFQDILARVSNVIRFWIGRLSVRDLGMEKSKVRRRTCHAQFSFITSNIMMNAVCNRQTSTQNSCIIWWFKYFLIMVPIALYLLYLREIWKRMWLKFLPSVLFHVPFYSWVRLCETWKSLLVGTLWTLF